MAKQQTPMTLALFFISYASAALHGCASPPAVGYAPAPAASGTVVPLRIVNYLPVVEVQTQGRTLQLIVDLGGTDALSLSQSALAELEVEFTGRSRTIFDAFGRLWRGREFFVPEVDLAGLALRDVRGYEIPDSRFNIPGGSGAEDAQLDGYIGVDLLRQFNVLVDYPNGRLVFVEHDAPPPVAIDDWPGSRFSFGRAGVVSPIRLDGRRIRANWDTGASHTVIRSDRANPDWPRWQRGPEEAVTAESLNIGGEDFGAFDLVLMDFRQPSVDVIIGTNLFEQRAVWFDFVNLRLAIDPSCATPQ